MNKKTLKIGLVQQKNTSDIVANKKRLIKNIEELANAGAELIVLPELHNSLYFCQTEDPLNFDLAEPIPGPSTQEFGELAKEKKVVIVLSLFERRAPGLYHNTCVVLDVDGQIAGKYRKMHIPDDPGYYEKFYFAQGDQGFTPVCTSIGRLGVLICWDQWYPEAARLSALGGADLLIYPTAIGFDSIDPQEEKQRQLEAWVTVQRGHAIANGLPVVAINRVGYEEHPQGLNGIEFFGNSFVCGQQGEFLFRAKGDEPVNQLVKIDMSKTETTRRIWPFFRDRRIEHFGDLTKRFLDNK